MKSEKATTLYNIRHSLAHMLAQAVLDMFPDAKLGTGPVTEHGFYYDFQLPRTLIPEDLPLLQKRMMKYVNQGQNFVRRDEPIQASIAFLKTIQQPFKVELVNKFVEQQGITSVSFYENFISGVKDGKPVFVDLCEGGHVESTKEIDAKSFKLNQISSAYWQADEKNASMQRIYGIAFETAAELQEFERLQEEAKKRDHRKLGKELDLYLTSAIVGAGLPLLSPHGTIIRYELEQFGREMQMKYGYQYVTSPHIAHLDLYKTSGHYPYYADSQFPPIHVDENEQYMLKPMNCPHHQQIFAAKSRSYKELPIRYAENATIYRLERTGELNGLTRVRSITQDDSHIFCTPDQMEAEINKVLDLAKEMYDTLGLKDVAYTLSLRDPENKEKYIGSDENWEKAESALRDALKKRKVEFTEHLGEAAFYGPKIDVKVRDVLGREWQIATIPQIDYNQPSRFGLTYIDEKGDKQTPIMLHRAIYGSYERFIGVIIEHFAGAFPTWLAPVQVHVLPLAEAHRDYSLGVTEMLHAKGVRVELAEPDDSLGKRIRNAEKLKIPYMLVIGDKELEANSVNVRSHKTGKQKDYKIEAFAKKLVKEIQERSL
jgi:threonyl-tRNA synthetase